MSINVPPFVHCAAFLPLLLTSCAVAKQWSADIEPSVVASGFSTDDLSKTRIALIPCVLSDGVPFANQEFDNHAVTSFQGALDQSAIIPVAASLVSMPIDGWIQHASEVQCEWLAAVYLLDVQQEQLEEVKEVECDSESKGSIITETYYWSKTTVRGRLEIYRVADSTLVFQTTGTVTHEHAEFEDDEDDGFLNWLFMLLFTSVDYPAFPAPSPVAEALIVELARGLTPSK